MGGHMGGHVLYQNALAAIPARDALVEADLLVILNLTADVTPLVAAIKQALDLEVSQRPAGRALLDTALADGLQHGGGRGDEAPERNLGLGAVQTQHELAGEVNALVTHDRALAREVGVIREPAALLVDGVEGRVGPVDVPADEALQDEL